MQCVEWCGSLSLIAQREGRSWQWISLSLLSAPPPPCCFLSCIFCPRCRWSPVLLRLLNRWPVGSLTLINLTSIRPEVIGMLQRWLQGSRAAQGSSCPLMNGSHRAQNVWVSAKSMAFKHGGARKDGGMNRWLKDRRDNSFVMCYVIAADLDGFILSICAQTSSLSPPRCSSFPPPSPVICTWNPSCLVPRVSLTLLFATYLSISGNKLRSLHITIHIPLCLSPSFSLNFLHHYSFLTFQALSDGHQYCIYFLLSIHTLYLGIICACITKNGSICCIGRGIIALFAVHVCVYCMYLSVYISWLTAIHVSVRELCWLSQSVLCTIHKKQLHLSTCLSAL